MKTSTNRFRAAFAMVEILVTTTSMLVIGGIIYNLLNVGTVLFAKNTAVNMAHQQARVAVLQMEQDLHASASIPQLTNAARTPIAGSGPAAGLTCLLFAAGPFQIVNTAASGQANITVRFNGYTPKVGQRLCLPLHQVELDISAVGGGSTDRTLTLASNLPRPVQTTLDNAGTAQSVIVTGFIADRYTYVVNDNGELRYFKPGDTVGKILANDITTSTPFSIPATPLGAAYNRFVAAINLSTTDHTSSKRGFKAANMFLNAMVPYRSKTCYYQ